jgi:phage terminase small subunit
MNLNPRQRAFADAYACDPERNATRAYIAVGYAARGNAAEVCAARLLRNVQVAAYVRQHEAEAREHAEERYQVTQEAVIAELVSMALLDPAQLVDREGNMRPLHAIPAHVRRALVIEQIAGGPIKVRVNVGKIDALDKLAKHLNLYEQHQKSGGLGEVAELMREIAERRSPESNPVERAKANHARA